MSKLFIFGDSFSVGAEGISTVKINYKKTVYARRSVGRGLKVNIEETTPWSTILADKLDVTDVANFAIFGCSNEYIFSRFTDCLAKNLIGRDDYIIFQTTSKYRHWFFEELPEYTRAMTGINNEFLSNEQVNAIKKYQTYLQNDSLDTNIFTFLIYGMMYFKTVIPNLLILSGWHDSPDCIGNLIDIDVNEFSHPDLKQKFLDKNNKIDRRINHLSQPNHEILADKIFNFFNNHQPIDLTNNFVTKIYT